MPPGSPAGGSGPGAAELGEGGGWGWGARGGSSGLGGGGDRAAEGPTALRAWPGLEAAAGGSGPRGGPSPGRRGGGGGAARPAWRDEVAECSREARADREQLGRLGPGWEGARGVRRGWVPAGLTDFLVLAGGGGSGVWDPAPGSREVTVHPSSGLAAAGGCAAGVDSGGLHFPLSSRC